MTFLHTGWRLLLGALSATVLTLAIFYFAFPEYLLQAINASARYSAGLERKSVEVDGHSIAYLEGGSGPTVVLLHGFGSTKDLWDGVATYLSPEYRVVIPDIPGFGESPALEGESYDAQNQARRLHAFLAEIGVGTHHIGGNSMGGTIAVVYAATYPKDVLSLLISAAPGVAARETSDMEQLIESGKNPLLIRSEADLDLLFQMAFFQAPSIPGQFKRAMVQDALKREATYLKIFDDLELAYPERAPLEQLLPDISSPTLIAWGAHDGLVHTSTAETFAAGIPGADITIFEECGHALPRECPDAMAQRYITFLNSVSPTDSAGNSKNQGKNQQ
jgi:abhydrolase domain-containing protein 6